MINITVTKVNNYEFVGFVEAHELTLKQLEVLGLERLADTDGQIEVNGSFSVWSDGYEEAYVDSVDSITLVGVPDGGTVKLPTSEKEVSKDLTGITVYKAIWKDVPTYKSLDLSEKDLSDPDNLIEQIEDSGQQGDWIQDRMESMADDAYDRYKDGE